MSRFLSLFGVLTALKKNMESRSGHDPKQKKEFVTAMEAIDKKELTKVVHFLRPLVQGIDFCQQDSSLQIDIVPMINGLLGITKSTRCRSLWKKLEREMVVPLIFLTRT